MYTNINQSLGNTDPGLTPTLLFIVFLFSFKTSWYETHEAESRHLTLRPWGWDKVVSGNRGTVAAAKSSGTENVEAQRAWHHTNVQRKIEKLLERNSKGYGNIISQDKSSINQEPPPPPPPPPLLARVPNVPPPSSNLPSWLYCLSPVG